MNFFPVKFLSHVNDYIEPMVIFTTWAKMYSSEYFCNARVAGLDELFVLQKFSMVCYLGLRLYNV